MEKKSKITAMLSVLLVSAPSTAKKITTSNLRNNAMRTTAVEIDGISIDDLDEAKEDKLKENDILYQLDQSMNENTKFVATLGDIFPASVADTEFGKLLPKLIDNSLTPEQFCAELTKKAQEAKQ